MMTAPPCGHGMMASRMALQETVVWSPTPFNSLKLSLKRVNPLKGLGHRDEAVTIFFNMSQPIFLAVTKITIFFTYQIVSTLPIGKDEILPIT